LQNLHDGGDDLVVLPSELKLKFFLKIFWNKQPDAAKTYFSKSNVLGNKYPNFNDVGYKSATDKLSDKDIASLRDLIQNDIFEVYNNIINKPSTPALWVAKEVGGSAKVILAFWRQLFFNGKVVLLLRDPLMVARSVIMDRRRKGIKLGVSKLWRQVEEPLWVLYDQLQLMDDSSVYFTFYEDLVDSPGDVMRGVSEYIGIEYSEKFDYPTIFGEKVVVLTSSQKTTEVFRSNKQWTDDLTIREIIIVWFYYRLVVFRIKFKKGKHKFTTYPDIVNKIKSLRGNKSATVFS